MKKWGIALSAATAVSLVLAGCSGSNGKNEASGGKEAEVKKEKIRAFTSFAGSDPWAPIWKEVVTEYTAANPGIEIVDESAPTSGGNDVHRTKMRADLAANNPADVVFYYTGQDAKDLADSGLFVDLGPALEADPEWKKGFMTGPLEKVKTNGGYFVLPYIGFYEGLFWNKEIFDKYSLEAPTTYDNLVKAVETLSGTDVIPFAASIKLPQYLLETFILSQAGPDGQKDHFDASWAPALDAIKDLYDKGAFPKDTLSLSDDDVRLLFGEGRASMMVNGSWAVNAVKDNPNMRVTAIPTLPGGQGGEHAIVSGYGSGWFLSKEASERSDESLKFIKYMTSPEIMARFLEAGGSPAITPSESKEGTAPIAVSAMEMLSKATAVEMPIDSQVSREAWMALNDSMGYIVGGKKSSLEVLEEAKKTEEKTKR